MTKDWEKGVYLHFKYMRSLYDVDFLTYTRYCWNLHPASGNQGVFREGGRFSQSSY